VGHDRVRADAAEPLGGRGGRQPGVGRAQPAEHGGGRLGACLGQDEVGGFGQLLVFGFDYADNPKAWRHSLELLSKEVLPKVQHLKPKQRKLAAE